MRIHDAHQRRFGGRRLLEPCRRRRFKTCATALICLALTGTCLLMLASSASAANFTWTGASTESHNWSDATNWGGTAPTGTLGTLEFPKLTSAACTAEPVIAACYETANDISGLNLNAISVNGPYTISDSLIDSPPGEAITLGAGGLTVQDEGGAGSLEGINIPIGLSVPQTWSINGGVYLGAAISGSEALDLNVSGGGGVTFNGGADTGPVTVTGSNASNTGESAQNNGAIWVGAPDPAENRVEEPDLNGFDANPVTVNDVALGTNDGTVGPLTVKGGDIIFGLLGAGPRLSVSGGATFDASSTMQMTINGSPAETNSSQVAANGAVNLGDAHLSLAARFTFGECNAPVGHVYTLVSATGSLEGTFAGLPDGSTVPLQRCNAPQPELRIDYTAHAVTATVIGSTFTWVGDEEALLEGADDWSDPANWGEGGAPAAQSALGTVEFSQLGGECGQDAFALPCYTSNNDLGGLSVQELKLNDDDDYEITGEPITLSSGGISASPVAGKHEVAGEFGPGLHMPIVLGAPQTWHIEGQSGAGVASSGVLLDGPLSGSSDELTIDTNNGAGLLLANDTEVGPVTIQGEDTGDTGYNARFNGGATEYPLSSLNSSDGEPVTVKDDSLNTVGAVGPLTSVGSEVGVLALSADEVRAGCYEEVPSSPSECVVPIQAGTLSLASATFDSNSNLTLAITNTEATPGTDYSRLTSTGAISLEGASLSVDLAPITTEASPACTLTLPVGQKYTFVSTTDTLSGISGVFGNAPESGSEIPLNQLEGDHSGDCSPSTQKLRIEYDTLSNPQTVTGTVVKPTTTPLAVTPASPITNGRYGAGSGTSASVARFEPTPPPILGQRQTVNVTAGTVTVHLRGTTRFVPLSGVSAIPDGSEVEATHGRVLITAATSTPGRTVSAEVYGGRFLIQQSHTGSGETHLTLSLPLTGCPRVTLPRGSAAMRTASAARGSGAKSRKLWVSDNGGSWGTNGRYVSTTVEGTHWLTLDECNQSRVTVAAGKVKVHDLIHKKTKVLTAGKTYVAAR